MYNSEILPNWLFAGIYASKLNGTNLYMKLEVRVGWHIDDYNCIILNYI